MANGRWDHFLTIKKFQIRNDLGTEYYKTSTLTSALSSVNDYWHYLLLVLYIIFITLFIINTVNFTNYISIDIL